MRKSVAVITGLFLWNVLGHASPAPGQRSGHGVETGTPFVKWFGPQEYEGTPQVFSIEQDQRGILYAGLSSGGLREYDGTSWRIIATPHNAIVRSLTHGTDGRIYAGEVGDFGYLQPDATGAMRFTSLLSFVPKADRDFQDIRKIHATPEGIYVQSFERLFFLKKEGSGWRTKVWKPQTKFRNSWYVFGKLYLSVSGVGLQKLNGDSLQTLPLAGLEKTPEALVMAMLPYSGAKAATEEILMVTSDNRFQLLNEHGLRPFPVEAGPWQKLGTSTAAAVLLDGAFGFGRRGGGLLVLERDGRIRHYLDRSAGIASDGVLVVFTDRVGTVWLGLQNGIARVEEASPFSEFGRVNGISAAVNGIVRYRGVLHLATMAGLKKFDPEAGQFIDLPEIGTAQVMGLLVYGDSLLAAAARDGIFEVTGKSVKPAIASNLAVVYFTMARSRQNPNRVWLATGEGLASMRRDESGHWVDEGLVAKTPEVRSIVEPVPGELWLGTMAQGVVRVRLHGDSLKNPEVKRFGQADGLAGEGGVNVSLAAGRVVFGSAKGVREFDPATGRFKPSQLFGAIPTGGGPEEYTLAADRKGNLWVNFGIRPVLLVSQKNGTFKLDQLRLRRIGDGVVQAMSLDDDGVVWLGGLERVFRYDPAKVRTTKESFPALIRQVTLGDKGQTVLYAGEGPAEQAAIPFRRNSLRFETAIASYEDSSKNQFQSRLEGFDNDWSAWTTETRRGYTNLPPGKFTFRVRARNLLGQESAETQFHLKILPPWYRTWWAYTLYGLALLAAVVGAYRVIRWRVVVRERAKSILREARFRAETAAAEAKTLQAENERNKNVQLLSDIGKDLTSSLNLDTILFKLYEHVSSLMDATIFRVGICSTQREEMQYRLVVEKGERLASYTLPNSERNQFAAWCVENRKPVFMGDASSESSQYGAIRDESGSLSGDGENPAAPESSVYLPLAMKDRVMGVITVQSFSKNAYTAYHLDLLENLAAYTSIALDNAEAYLNLKSAQEQMMVQERLASLGTLTAGIAHEIKNPLNFVNNFADLSIELMSELREEIDKLKAGTSADIENMDLLISDLTGNAMKINEHGKRADGIVRSMLLHSRGQAGERQLTDINAMLDEYVNLSYHGMRAQDSSFNATIEREFCSGVGMLDVIPQELSRVFLNLLNNACYAIHERAKKGVPGYAPTLRVRTVNLGDSIEVRIRDNGTGMPPEVRDKIFNPFFTTKPTGQGTGLGLSISHDIIVQEHGGQLEVDTEAGQFTEFVVRLPRQRRKAA